MAPDGIYAVFALRTSLGEEGAEPLVWFGSFPLFSEISVRLQQRHASVIVVRQLGGS